MRVSDFTELPKLYPIHHIKCTKYGLDPPKFAYIEGITPDSDEPSDEGDDNIEYEIYVSQPWMMILKYQQKVILKLNLRIIHHYKNQLKILSQLQKIWTRI